jgi:hypothetical protein
MPLWNLGDPLPSGELRVWLDDLLEDRAAPAGWMHVVDAPTAVALLDTGRVIELSLDHDLGDDDVAGRGVHVVDHIAQREFSGARGAWPRDGITLRGADPAGRGQMVRAIARYAGARHHVQRSITAGGKVRFEFLPLSDADR